MPRYTTEELLSGDSRKISERLGHMTKTTASQNPDRNPLNKNLSTMSQLFLMESPLIVNQYSVTSSINSVMEGILSREFSRNRIADSTLNLIPEDLTRRVVNAAATGALGPIGTGLYVGGAIAGAVVNVADAIKGVLSPDTRASDRRDGMGRLKPNAVQGYILVRDLGFDGTIGGYRDGDPSKSDHPRGLAIDVMVGMSSDGRQNGDLIANFFLKYRKEMGVKYIIWHDRIASSRQPAWQWRHYSHRNVPNGREAESQYDTLQHRDHPHISFVSQNAPGINLPDKLVSGASSGEGGGGGGSW